MIGFGTALAGLGGAAPQIQQMQEQARQRQAMQNIVRMYMTQQQPQSPGGIQPAGQMPQPPAQQDYMTQIAGAPPQGGGSAPQTQARPVPALPGSQPMDGGDSNALMNAYIQKMMQDPTGMESFARRIQSSGIPESEWGDTLAAGAPMMKGAMSPEERLMATMMNVQQRQYGSEPARYNAGLTTPEGKKPPKSSKPTSLANDTQYQALKNTAELQRQRAINPAIVGTDHDQAMKDFERANKAVSDYGKRKGGADDSASPETGGESVGSPDISQLSDKEERSLDGGKTWWHIVDGKAVQAGE